MTSTNYTVGLGNEKASSRILKPPGGASSDIFGTSSGQENVGRRTNNYNKSNMFEDASATPAEQASENRRQADEGHQESADSANSTDNSTDPTGSSKQGGGNPITGEGYNAENKDDGSLFPGGKGRNPPGGHSTKLW